MNKQRKFCIEIIKKLIIRYWALCAYLFDVFIIEHTMEMETIFMVYLLNQ